jgi:hypothetical protein
VRGAVATALEFAKLGRKLAAQGYVEGPDAVRVSWIPPRRMPPSALRLTVTDAPEQLPRPIAAPIPAVCSDLEVRAECLDYALRRNERMGMAACRRPSIGVRGGPGYERDL